MTGAAVATPPDHRLRATLIGGTAVLMWGLLALFTTLTGHVPPFLLAGLAFSVATALIVVKWLVRREPIGRYLRQPWRAWMAGTAGLFGYHFFYFMALRHAPPVQAGLICYLWPLLIVVFSALLPGERLRWFHVLGALAGLAGTVLLVTNGKGIAGFEWRFALGYGMAVCAALTWSTYSVGNRRFGRVPTDTVGGFCALTAVLAFTCHALFEPAVWPQGAGQWLAVVGLGLGPVGAAFFTWDFGTKHGNLQVLGAFSYAAPLISTVLLLVFGFGEPTWVVAAGCVLIVGGAVLASKELLWRTA